MLINARFARTGVVPRVRRVAEVEVDAPGIPRRCARGRRGEAQRPTIASTLAFRKRSTSSMKPIDGISSSSAVIEAIW